MEGRARKHTEGKVGKLTWEGKMEKSRTGKKQEF